MPGGDGESLPSGRVTLLLTDVEGSTAAWDQDPPTMDARMERHDAFAAATVAAHGGLLLKSKGEGDSTFSVFAEPAAAVGAALDLIRGLPGAEFDLPVRAAVHTGDVVPRDGDYFGPVPNRAARLRGLAAGGQVLLSSSVVASMGDRLPTGAEIVPLGTHQLRGLAEPEEVFGLGHPDLSPVEPLVVVRPPSNLPAPVDAFVGRDDDRTALEKALGRYRLVTIVGPGGVGKTRVALEIAADQAHALPGGTWFVDVGALTAPDQVAAAVVAAIGAELEPGADPIATVAAALEGPAMLVLDTSEAHLDAAAETADQLLLACANLSILATSREALGVRGEAVLRLEPLSVGGDPDDGPSDAARLFTLRAGAADLTNQAELDPAVVERICLALDGIPLAIELAAAQVGVLELEELADQLAYAVGVEETGPARRSGPARQRTVRATVEWSLQSATEDERRLLSRLTVFVGGWPRGAPEAVCADDQLSAAAVTQAHRGLVARSLVVTSPDTGAGVRHRLLEAVRTIAAERLETDAQAALADRFLSWSVATAVTLNDDTDTGALPDWVAHFVAEMPNLRAGIAQAIAIGDASAAQEIGYAATGAWQATGAFAEAADALDAALAAGGGGAPRAKTLAASALMAVRTGDLDKAGRAIGEAVSIVQGDSELEDVTRCDVLGVAALLADVEGREDDARSFCADALVAARRSGNPMALVVALNNLAVSLSPAEHPERLRLLEEVATLEAELGINVVAQVQYALALGLGGRSARGLAVIERLEHGDVGSYARFALESAQAQLELQLARYADAAETARACLAKGVAIGLAGDEIDDATLSLARALRHVGQVDEALAACRAITSVDYRDPAVLEEVEILLDRGQLEAAEEQLARAADSAHGSYDRAAALVDLARGRAEQAFERAQAARQQKAASGLGYFERLLLEVELTAATTLGRTDDVSALTARLEELIQQAESV